MAITEEMVNAKERIAIIKFKQIELTNELNNAARDAYPVGSEVQFYKGGNLITAGIIAFQPSNSTSQEPRFFIKSHTGNEYWIDLFWIMREND